MANVMAVDRAYIERLQGWVVGEARRVATSPNDKGINALSRHTEKVLAPFGVEGFSTTVISRWVNGEVKQELRAESLERIGLLRGFSKDKDQARQLAYIWLSTGQTPGEVSPLAISPQEADRAASQGQEDIAKQIAQGQFTVEQLKAMMIAAIEHLAAIATSSQQPSSDTKDRVQPVETTLKWLLNGLINGGKTTHEKLAAEIGVDKDRIVELIEGYPMTVEECHAMARFTNLKPESLAEWGLCPDLIPGDCQR